MIKKIKKSIKLYSKFPKSIYILFIATVVNKLGNFVLPFLTIFLTRNLGFGAGKVGIFIMIGGAIYVPGSILGGKLADSFGRKNVLITCQALAGLCFIPCAIYPNTIKTAWLLFASIFFSAAAEPASNAMIIDLTNHKNRNEIYSFLYLGNNIGIAIGPVVAGFLYNKYIEWIFLGDAITTAVALILIVRYVKETRPSEEHIIKSIGDKSNQERAEDKGLIGALMKRPLLLIFSLISIIYSFVYAQNMFVIPLQVEKIFGNSSTAVFGTIMACNAIVVVTLTTFITAVTKKYSSIINITVAGVFYALGFGMLFFVKSYMMFILSTIIWTIGEVLAFTNQGVFIANHTPISHRGRFNAILPLITGAGRAIGPAIMGQFIKFTNIKMAWVLVFILSIMASSMMYMLYLKERRSATH